MGIVSESATTGSTTDEPAESSSSTTGPPPPACYDVDPVPDGFTPDGECDPYGNDCAVGDKCSYQDSDADGYYDETVCVTIDDNPAQPGDACSLDPDTLDGIDDCDAGAFCYLGFESGSGVCVPLAGGSADSPTCDDPDSDVTLVHDTAVLCLQTCSPLLADCAAGSSCMLSYGIYYCMDNAVAEAGPGGEIPCDNSSDCSMGYSCQEGTCREHCDASGAACDCVAMCDPYPGAENFGLCF